MKGRIMDQQINVVLTVDNSLFEKVCQEGFEALPKEKLQEVLLLAIKEALGQDKEKKSLYNKGEILVKPRECGYQTIYEPTDMFKKILSSFDYEKYLGDITKEISEYIKNNYKKIVQDAVVKAFSTSLLNYDKIREMQDSISSQVLWGVNNNKQC